MVPDCGSGSSSSVSSEEDLAAFVPSRHRLVRLRSVAMAEVTAGKANAPPALAPEPDEEVPTLVSESQGFVAITTIDQRYLKLQLEQETETTAEAKGTRRDLAGRVHKSGQ